jgi:hypothetical protein
MPGGFTALSPEDLRAHAAEVKQTVNEKFWNPAAGRFVGTIDADGVPRDYGFTFVNLEAIHYPRNDDPGKFNARLITPYFAHYVMPLFIERGRMDFVLEQFRRCWGGFLLANGRTTWLEVFDTRWSHCHQWSGCPIWQLSRYLLGLHPRFDLGAAHYDFLCQPGSPVTQCVMRSRGPRAPSRVAPCASRGALA